jgi:hypothetical protein
MPLNWDFILRRLAASISVSRDRCTVQYLRILISGLTEPLLWPKLVNLGPSFLIEFLDAGYAERTQMSFQCLLPSHLVVLSNAWFSLLPGLMPLVKTLTESSQIPGTDT